MHEQHGQTKHPIYTSWRAMRRRCLVQHDEHWHAYGGRGIAIAEEWSSFPAFFSWSLANGWQPGLTIDRKDVDGNYEPNNCRWATRKEQSINRRPQLAVSIDGKTLSVLQWAKATGIPQATLYKRYHAGVRGRAFIAAPINPATPKGVPARPTLFPTPALKEVNR